MGRLRNQNKGINVAHIVQLALIMLLFVQVYSYVGAEWEITRNQWTNVALASQMARINSMMLCLKYGAFVLLLLAFFSVAKITSSEAVGLILISTFCVLYTVVDVMDDGIISSLYSSNIAIMYLLIVGFWLGRTKMIWDGVKKCVPCFLVIYIVMFAYEFIMSFGKFGWVIYQNSSLMNYYSHIFCMSIFYIYHKIDKKKPTPIIYFLLIFLVLGAFIIRSRAWIIQSVLMLVVVSVAISFLKKRSVAGAVKVLAFLLVFAIGVFWILSSYFGEFVASIVDKGTTDSRSFQYVEIFQQTEWYLWILGQGTDATYQSALYGEYSFIDNEFVYLSFHYGVIFACLYFWPYVKTIFKCFSSKKYMHLAVFSACLIILWIFSVNGLSVFNRITLDVKSFIMPFFVGHIYHTAKTACLCGADDENTVCS
ncbi:MAG: hypothetical protein IJX92_01320 [Clostridia bacterium]|nr:hypothetical protein [Clostridia bacterium]